MNKKSIRCERVFDVHRRKASKGSPPHSVFGFDSKLGKHFSVKVPQHPQIYSGMNLFVILEENDNWDTVIGWTNLDTGEVVSKYEPSSCFDNLVMSFLWLLTALTFILLALTKTKWFLLVLPVLVIQIHRFIVNELVYKRVHRILLQRSARLNQCLSRTK